MCGIFGIVATKPRRFDYTTFCTLGVHNDVRGGDSCGVFIDGQVEYGVDKKKYFETFMPESKLVQETKEATIAFGHDRKASVGVVNEKTAQPVVIYNKETGAVDFVLMHNGTIYNYKDLAKKYLPGIDITGMTDSQVMANIFYNAGYDALKEYNGAAVFAIADYRQTDGINPRIYFWQGASPDSYAGQPKEERPLYFALDKDHLTFSSLKTFLPVLERNAEILIIEPNWLFTYTDNKLIAVAEYSRKDQFQYNRTGFASISTYRGGYGSSYTPPCYGNYGYVYDDYDDDDTNPSYATNVLYGSTKDGRCYQNGKVAHGKVMVTSYGYINSVNNMYECWFFGGILMKNKEHFDYLCKISQEFGATPTEMFEIYPELVLFLSPYPYLRTLNGLVEEVDSPISSTEFTGSFFFPFTSTQYTTKDGKTSSTVTKSMGEAFSEFLAHREDKLPKAELITNFGDYENVDY